MFALARYRPEEPVQGDFPSRKHTWRRLFTAARVRWNTVFDQAIGIIVSMYYFDDRRHHLPHIHVKYQEQEVVIAIPVGEVLEGKLKSNKMKLVQAWIEIHQDELLANWELASQGENIFKIDPLK